MTEVVTVGEILVEIMRKKVDQGLEKPDGFVGPFPSGAPAIFTDAVRRLGVDSSIIGGVGNDEFGNCVLNRLKEDGVDITGIKKVNYPPTGTAFVSYFSDGSRKFLYHMENSAAGTIGREDVERSFVKNAGALHLSGSALAMGRKMRKACKKALDIADKSGLLISFDPNIRATLLKKSEIEEVFSFAKKSADILTPSTEELETITGSKDEDKAAKELLKNSSLVAVKDGGNGCRLYTDKDSVGSGAYEVEEVDSTGAGDAFSAGIVVGWLEGMELRKLSLFANAVGGKAVTEKGPMEGLAWREEIEEMIEKQTE